MKTITVNVSHPIYADFRDFAARSQRKTSELIREAMEEYHQAHIDRRGTLLARRPVSVGGPIEPVLPEDDILEEMMDDPRS